MSLCSRLSIFPIIYSITERIIPRAGTTIAAEIPAPTITPAPAFLPAALFTLVLAAAAFAKVVEPCAPFDCDRLAMLLIEVMDIDDGPAEVDDEEEVMLEDMLMLAFILALALTEAEAPAPAGVIEIPGPDPTAIERICDADPLAALTYHGIPHASATFNVFQPACLAAG